jgi:hypothetical protein
MAKARPARRARGTTLLIGTRKGAFLLDDDGKRKAWKLSGPHFLGSIVNHLVLDPRDGRTLLMAARTGHLGPTIYRSTDRGKTWTESATPPAFAKAEGDAKAKAVEFTAWLTPGHSDEPGVWYAGTTPAGLFRSADGGATWSGVAGFNDMLLRPEVAKFIGGIPDGPATHSILVDPRDRTHLYLGISSGGTFESLDGGASWTPLNQGVAAVFMPDPDPLMGHDPHCMALHPLRPDRLWQQNHCGIYRLDRPGTRWTRVGDAMPKAVGDIGFPIVLHPRDPDQAWVFPMDGTDVWPRTSPGGKPAVYTTRNAGKSWQRQDKGLPRSHAYWTVKRQCFCADGGEAVGLYFGTTSGEIWASRDGGGSWKRIAEHLPHICSVVATER